MFVASATALGDGRILEGFQVASFGGNLLAVALAGTAPGEHPLRHVVELPSRSGRRHDWPAWAEPDVVRAFADRGISSPWSHQFEAAELAHAGTHVVVSTGTASGKSLAYQLPVLNALATDPRARVLYLSPTKALGHDQLRAAHALTSAVPRLADVAPTAYDGDSPAEVRRFARERSRWLFSNPDMIHLSILRNHARWAVLLRGLRFVIVDECHYYRGVFGSNVAMVLRRLLRLCARYSARPQFQPTFIFASATTDSPGATAAELIGQPVEEVVEDGSPQGARTVGLWEPALRADLTGENGAPVRRSAGAEAARVMADLIAVHASQLTRIAADPLGSRFGLLAAAESAGGLAAAEMTAAGLPWRADVHDELLTELLGSRPAAAPGQPLRPARLAELVTEISAALGAVRPVNPDSPAQLLRALAASGIRVPSTRTSVLRGVDHPVIPLLLRYKELARLHTANGWSWLDTWVADGRFRPEYIVGGVVSGRWATRGGGALQIPKVLRRAVVADPGCALVVADAAQLEPRVLAALAGDRGFTQAAASGDVYTAVGQALGIDRDRSKIALLSAMYGGTGGDGGQSLALLRRRFPQASAFVEAGGPVRARPHLPAAVGRLAFRDQRGRRPRAGARSGRGPGAARPRPVHPQLRGAGQRRGLGAGTHRRAAPEPDRPGRTRSGGVSSGRATRAGLLPAR